MSATKQCSVCQRPYTTYCAACATMKDEGYGEGGFVEGIHAVRDELSKEGVEIDAEQAFADSDPFLGVRASESTLAGAFPADAVDAAVADASRTFRTVASTLPAPREDRLTELVRWIVEDSTEDGCVPSDVSLTYDGEAKDWRARIFTYGTEGWTASTTMSDPLLALEHLHGLVKANGGGR